MTVCDQCGGKLILTERLYPKGVKLPDNALSVYGVGDSLNRYGYGLADLTCSDCGQVEHGWRVLDLSSEAAHAIDHAVRVIAI